jgi:hypothetical protein
LANRPINWPVILTGRHTPTEPVSGVPAPGETNPPVTRPAVAVPNRGGSQTPDRKRGRNPNHSRSSPGPRPTARSDKGGVLDVTIGSGGDGQ